MGLIGGFGSAWDKGASNQNRRSSAGLCLRPVRNGRYWCMTCWLDSFIWMALHGLGVFTVNLRISAVFINEGHVIWDGFVLCAEGLASSVRFMQLCAGACTAALKPVLQFFTRRVVLPASKRVLFKVDRRFVQQGGLHRSPRLCSGTLKKNHRVPLLVSFSACPEREQ